MEDYSMSLKSQNGTYLIKGDFEHKEKYDIGLPEPLHIVKTFENNLLRRNCQIGFIMAIPDDNPLKLSIGDKVYVHHMVFFGEIAKDTKDHQLQPHVKHEKELLFRCYPKDIYLKFNELGFDMLGEYLICEPIEEELIQSGIYMGTIKHKDRAKLLRGNGEFNDGDVVFVESHALYEIEIDKKAYYRIREKEVMGTIVDGEIIPANDRILVAGEPKKGNEVSLDMFITCRDTEAEVLAVGSRVRDYKSGDTVLRRKSGGKKFGDNVIITVQGLLDDDSVYGTVLKETA
jgi:hypothetical protein